MNFDQLGLKPEILRAVDSLGYKTTTPIQAKSIPAILDRKDVMGGAQTGTGKTAAFALPILNVLSDKTSSSKHPRALILTPTRELADQVGNSFVNYGKNLNLRSATIYGGVNIKPQMASLRKGLDVITATPGRLLDHIGQKTIDLSKVEILVLDEADRMLDMGFIRDIKRIISYLPGKRQNLLFSATYGDDIKSLANGILNNPVSVEVARRNTAAEKVDQMVHYVEKNQKRHLLAHLIKEGSWFQVLVFVKTKHGANRLATQLGKSGIPSMAIHGDKSQGARTRALNDFKSGDLQALIATDIAARGLQIDDLGHVVNFDLPQVPEDYVHRIGRTGRAGKSGTAISLITTEDKKQLRKIEKVLKSSIPEESVKGFVPVKIQAQPAGNSTGRSNNSPKKDEKSNGNWHRKFHPKTSASKKRNSSKRR
ncbi:MAG: DEAD/DEAH box helicase [Proteobacteria bacterium]|nr:DEAD/DEAH box helicase [Pseudomonadota bacterium]